MITDEEHEDALDELALIAETKKALEIQMQNATEEVTRQVLITLRMRDKKMTDKEQEAFHEALIDAEKDTLAILSDALHDLYDTRESAAEAIRAEYDDRESAEHYRQESTAAI